MIRILLTTLMIMLFNGCSDKAILNPEFTKEIESILSVKTTEPECEYPKLPIYYAPKKERVPKGTTREEALNMCQDKNNQLRFIIYKQNLVIKKTNKEYNNVK